MAFFAVRPHNSWKGRRSPSRKTGIARSVGVALAALSAVSLLSAPAQAQTIGSSNGVTNGNGLLAEFINQSGLLAPPQFTSLIDLTGMAASFIANPYIGVTVGLTGSYSVPWAAGDGGSVTHNVGGMLSIGNVKGSLRWSSDDLQPLNGLDYPVPPYELLSGNTRLGYGVWPIPGHWQAGGGFLIYDYSSYARLQIDTTAAGQPAQIIPIVGNGTLVGTEPQFINNVLSADFNETISANAGTNPIMRVHLEIRLFRATAQFKWTLTNLDSVSHTATLRWTVPVRPGIPQNTTASTFTLPMTGFFFESPGIGLSDDARLLTGANIPDTFSVYGKRYDTDDPADPPFAATFRFRGFGATTPSQVYLAHPFDVRPEDTTFPPSFNHAKLGDGLSVASYFGPNGLAPGASTTITTYYGNGSVTERPDGDFVVAAEGPESLGYNQAAATDPTVAGNGTANPVELKAIAAKFLTRSPFQIWGGIYNRVESNPQTALNLTNVRTTITLPTGLVLAPGPGATAPDASEKVIGTLNADRGIDFAWYVAPTADVFGTLPYQVNVSSNELGARQVTRTVNLPSVPIRSVTASSYQMIGFPFEFDPVLSNNGDPSTVINGITSLKDDNPAFYKYVGLPGQPYQVVSHLENGFGYFYRPNFNRTFIAKGVRPLPGQATTGGTTFRDLPQRQITLEPGWNMISNPYVYDLPLKYIRFVPTQDNPNAQSQTFQQAIDTGLVRAGVFFYDTTTKSYDFLENLDDVLNPWNAYWIFTTSRVALVYTLPVQKESVVLPGPDPANPNPATRKVGFFKNGRGFNSNSISDWRLQLVASGGDGNSDRSVLIGQTGTALTVNQATTPKPPAPMSDYVYLGVVKKEGETRYARDIRSTKGTQSWNLEVIADKDGPVTLSWPNVSTLPRNVSLTLKDSATGKSIGLRSNAAFTVNLKKGTPSRLVLTASTGSSQPLVISGLRALPGATRSATRTFAFNLNREATITGVVKTVTGKTVANIATSRAATMGENKLTWTGRSQEGSPLPPGAYVIEITARADDGDPVSVRQVFQSLQ